MFEFPREVVHRDGYKFISELKDGKFIYKTSDKNEIDVLQKNGFKNLVVKQTKKKES